MRMGLKRDQALSLLKSIIWGFAMAIIISRILCADRSELALIFLMYFVPMAGISYLMLEKARAINRAKSTNIELAGIIAYFAAMLAIDRCFGPAACAIWAFLLLAYLWIQAQRIQLSF